jgi:activator of HSP90 ATPase
MAENIRLSDIIPAAPARVYEAFLDAREHAAMTGAGVTDEGDGKFTAWDGYISGRTVAAQPHSKLVQAWRTSEFPERAKDSKLTITFAPEAGGTRVTIIHTTIPDGQGASYEQGWREYYFEPMKQHFGAPLAQGGEVSERVVKAVKRVQRRATGQRKPASKKGKARATPRRKARPAAKQRR